MRLTKDVIQKLLVKNEGFSKTYNDNGGRNFKATNHYLIKGGKFHTLYWQDNMGR